MTWQEMLAKADECAKRAADLLALDTISKEVSFKAEAYTRLAEYLFKRAGLAKREYTPYA